MCRTTKRDPGKSVGRAPTRCISASTPPADAPITKMSWVIASISCACRTFPLSFNVCKTSDPCRRYAILPEKVTKPVIFFPGQKEEKMAYIHEQRFDNAKRKEQ